VQRDSTSHLTIFHTGSSDKINITTTAYSDTLNRILPDIKIKNGIVDHKGMTGEMLVREYFADSSLIGYIEYDGLHFLRERYFYPDGSTFMDKQYDQGNLSHTDHRRYLPIRK
jgi:antitoxin component YwqK of YwqJK toxin-antitoxin module